MLDELQKRRQELQAQKEIELERQARGEGNDLDLFVINEELLDVIAQIRSLSPASWKWGKKRSQSSADFLPDKKSQFIDWRTENWALDDEIDEEHARLQKAAAAALDLLTPRQREFLKLHAKGLNCYKIADMLGLDRSGVCRTMRRAKKSAREIADKLLSGGKIISLADPGVMEKVLVALSPLQAAHFYLFYSEGWTAKQIMTLTGSGSFRVEWHLRLIRSRLSAALGGENIFLVHTEALDEPAYQMFCELKAHPELFPEYIPYPQYPQGPPIRILKNVKEDDRPGNLRSALMNRGPEMVQDMAIIFTAIRNQLKPHRTWYVPSAPLSKPEWLTSTVEAETHNEQKS